MDRRRSDGELRWENVEKEERERQRGERWEKITESRCCRTY